MSDPTLTQIDDRELENMSVDAANFPYIKQRGMLGWNGSAWVKSGGGATSSAPTTGQVKVAVTGTAVQFPSNTVINGVIIAANTGNTAKVTIGPSGVTNTVDGTGNGFVLVQGSSSSAAVSNTNALYLNGTAGDWVSFIAS